jgi:hypothetical protein
VASSPIAQAFPIVRRALKILADREVSPQTGLLKSTLLQLDSTFSERTYGASSFLDFVEKLSKLGLVQLKHAGRSVMVELNAAADDGESATATPVLPASAPASASAEPGPVPAQEPPPQIGDGHMGVKLAAEILAAATQARWPMYLRNVKQLLRAAGFDERRYGFGGLLDLLKACQREGLVRVERDRRGGLRVFLGAAMARGAEPRIETTALPLVEPELLPTDDSFAAAAAPPDEDAEGHEPQPAAVVDATAELLGRAKPRRTRSRSAGPAAPAAPGEARGGRKRTAKKPAAAPRGRRPKKGAAEEPLDESREA